MLPKQENSVQQLYYKVVLSYFFKTSILEVPHCPDFQKFQLNLLKLQRRGTSNNHHWSHLTQNQCLSFDDPYLKALSPDSTQIQTELHGTRLTTTVSSCHSSTWGLLSVLSIIVWNKPRWATYIRFWAVKPSFLCPNVVKKTLVT